MWSRSTSTLRCNTTTGRGISAMTSSTRSSLPTAPFLWSPSSIPAYQARTMASAAAGGSRSSGRGSTWAVLAAATGVTFAGLALWQNEIARHYNDHTIVRAAGISDLFRGNTKEAPIPAPGDKPSLKTQALEVGAAFVQSKSPIKAIHQCLCGMHMYSGDPERQVIAYHYCSHLSEEVSQCVIYDSGDADARLIGIEYIISDRLFQKLPEEEKKYWHSHVYEVKSGMLIAPSIPAVLEKALMKDLVTTYGKTIHTWQVDRGDELPLGPPQLMMSFTSDEQVNKKLLKHRDEVLGASTEQKRIERLDIDTPRIVPGADSHAYQLEAKQMLAMKKQQANK